MLNEYLISMKLGNKINSHYFKSPFIFKCQAEISTNTAHRKNKISRIINPRFGKEWEGN